MSDSRRQGSSEFPSWGNQRCLKRLLWLCGQHNYVSRHTECLCKILSFERPPRKNHSHNASVALCSNATVFQDLYLCLGRDNFFQLAQFDFLISRELCKGKWQRVSSNDSQTRIKKQTNINEFMRHHNWGIFSQIVFHCLSNCWYRSLCQDVNETFLKSHQRTTTIYVCSIQVQLLSSFYPKYSTSHTSVNIC